MRERELGRKNPRDPGKVRLPIDGQGGGWG